MIRDMGSKYGKKLRKPMWLPILLLAGAVLMFVGAIATNKEEVNQYIPLNEAVEQALLQIDNNAERANELVAEESASALQPSQTQSVQSEKEESDSSANNTAHTEHEESETIQSDSRIDINRASLSELQSLKGIGPSKANAIILEREKNGFFRSPEDLLRVKGIGNKLLLEIKESIVARP